MKVVIEARALNSKATAGVKTYVRELVKNLQKIGGAEYEIVTDNPPAWQLPYWMNVTVANRIKESEADLVHFTKSATAWRKVAPTVVTIHDIIPILFPSSQEFMRRITWPRALKHAAKNSDHIITVSEASKRDIVELLGVSPEKITVTTEAVDVARFNPERVLPLLHPHSAGVSNFPSGERGAPVASPVSAGPYILFVGTRDMRKNVPLLIRAFARISEDVPHQLVIAGRQALKLNDDQRQAHQLGLDKRVTWLDFVPDKDLPALYAGADLFVWPSAYEGWGLPPMEAMASGVPVIVSNGGALPEVVGSAGEIVSFTEKNLKARTWDMSFEEALTQRMLAVLEDDNKRAAMRQLGIERVRQFSWRSLAEKTLEVYKKVAAI